MTSNSDSCLRTFSSRLTAFSLSISRSSGPGCAKETFASKSEGLSAAAEETIRLGEQIQSYEKEMPFYMQGRNLVTFQLKQVASEVEHLGKKIQKLASLQQEIAACYQKADEQTEELCNQ